MNELIYHKAQQKLHDEQTVFNVVSHGRRFGMTTFMLNEALEEMISHKCDVAYCVPTSNTFEEVWSMVINSIVSDKLKQNKIEKEQFTGTYLKICKEERVLQIGNGSRLIFYKMYNNDKPCLGHKFSKVFIDGADYMKELKSQWKYIVDSITEENFTGCIFVASDVGLDMNSFFKELSKYAIDVQERGLLFKWKFWRMPTKKNKSIAGLKEYLKEQRMKITESEYMRMYQGKFQPDVKLLDNLVFDMSDLSNCPNCPNVTYRAFSKVFGNG